MQYKPRKICHHLSDRNNCRFGLCAKQAALRALQINKINKRVVKVGVDPLRELAEDNKVIIIWIKAHRGNAVNESAGS